MTVMLAALAGVSFGALAVAVRWGLDQGVGAELAALVAAGVGAILSATLLGLIGRQGLSLGPLWPFFAVGLLAPGASQILLTLAVRHAGPSRASVFLGMAPLLSVIAAVAVLGERFRLVLALGTALIVSGGVVLALEQGRPREVRTRGIVLAIVCAAVFACRDNLLRFAAVGAHPSPLPAATATLLGAVTFLLGFMIATRRLQLSMLRPGVWAFAPAGVALSGGYDALLAAYDRGGVSIVAPLNATGSLWAVLFSILLYRRREMVGKRTVAAALLVVAGGALIGVEH